MNSNTKCFLDFMACKRAGWLGTYEEWLRTWMLVINFDVAYGGV